MKTKLKNNVGFSLIELLLSLAILGIVMIGITSLLVSTTKINKLSEKQYNATLIAKSYIELVKATEDFNIGQTIYLVDNAKVIINISDISRYQGEMCKIDVKVIIDDETIERLHGYKLLFR